MVRFFSLRLTVCSLSVPLSVQLVILSISSSFILFPLFLLDLRQIGGEDAEGNTIPGEVWPFSMISANETMIKKLFGKVRGCVWVCGCECVSV